MIYLIQYVTDHWNEYGDRRTSNWFLTKNLYPVLAIVGASLIITQVRKTLYFLKKFKFFHFLILINYFLKLPRRIQFLILVLQLNALKSFKYKNFKSLRSLIN